VLLALVVLVLLVAILRRRSGRTQLALPALLPVMRWSPLAPTRHLPVILFLLGMPIFAVALADPQTGFAREEVSYPGRRIAMLVDGSTSMVIRFESTAKRQGEATFFTAVAAAEQFIKRRMNGPYRDLVALIQFGNYAYVVTPFTNDYENILLSARLISDPREWGRFPDWGTTIIEGVDQATQLFKTFDFINASGNLMRRRGRGRFPSICCAPPTTGVRAKCSRTRSGVRPSSAPAAGSMPPTTTSRSPARCVRSIDCRPAESRREITAWLVRGTPAGR
jgi:hypothetical protein